MREFRKTLLIICEGVRSEPNYFHSLRNKVIELNGTDLFIKVMPIPEEEQQKIIADEENFQLRKGAKKRVLRKSIKPHQEMIEYSVENEYKAQPVSYIRKAQLAYQDEAFDELWAVYDKDGHTHHLEAYELACNEEVCNKRVNIGFSSISFELWTLLHFEYTDLEFTKSQCRVERIVIDCGEENGDPDNCMGSKCVVGRIISQNYLEYEKNKHFEYAKYSDNVHKAFKNALLVRSRQSQEAPFYDKNPYLTIDRLVFKLLNFNKSDHEWIETKSFQLEPNINVEITCEVEHCKVCIRNNSNVAYILQNEVIKFIDVEYNVLCANNRVMLVPSDFREFVFNIDDFDYLVICRDIKSSFILDNVFIKTGIYI